MLEVIQLSGEAFARGRAHGQVLRPRIEAHLADWLAALAAGGVGEPEAYVRGMLRDTGFDAAARRHAPDLLDEVRGIADGAALDPDLIFALQLIDEEWAYRARLRVAPQKREKCSSFAYVAPGGPTWIGQNMDLGAYTDGHQAALSIGPDGEAPAALMFSIAGVIGLMGVNAAGVGVCVNSLPQLPSAAEGLPVAFMIRRLLQARSLGEAASLVVELPHATNQHYLIAEAGAVRSFEACAAGVTEYRPRDASRVLHTNHPLSDEPGAPETPHARENSETRLASLTDRLSSGEPGLAEFQAALSSFDDARHPVCRLRNSAEGLIGFTTGSMISALPGGAGAVDSWISPGPPSLAGYTHLTLTAAGAPAP